MDDDLTRLRAALLLLEQINFSKFGDLYDAIPWDKLEQAATGGVA